MIKTSISILDCDFNNIEYEIDRVNNSNTDLIHIDIMDGKFVPNNTLKKFDMDKLSKYSNKNFDVHLMVENPLEHIESYDTPITNYITVHLESKKTDQSLMSIKDRGIKCGLAINPDTKIKKLYPYLETIDMVIIMSVFPGKGGQKFIDSTFSRVESLRNYNNNIDISVDGGVESSNSKILISKGASILVSGSYLMKSKDINNSIKNMLKHT